MSRDVSWTDSTATDDQVVVIGSGPCGAIAAARLVDRGARVVLLDAGLAAPRGAVVRAAGNTLFRSVDMTQLENDRHEPAGGAVDWYSSRSLGGLSNYWTAAVPRFASNDFDEGERLDVRYRWPISYSDLEPHYRDVERKLVVTAGSGLANVPRNHARFGIELPRDWSELVASAARHGHNGAPMPMAKGRPWMAVRRGTEFNSYHCVVEPMLGRANFRLVAGALVTRLNWSGQEQRVVSVDFVDRVTGDRTTVRSRAVVLAAGAIDTPVLLLRSRSTDFPNGLGNAADLIGRYLHDHPRDWWVARPGRPMRALAHPLYISRADYDDSDPLLATSLTVGLAARRDRLRTYVRASSATVGVQVFGTMVPTPDVGVSIPAKVAGDEVSVRPTVSLRYDGAAIANLRSARERLVEFFTDGGSSIAVSDRFDDLTPGSSVHFGGAVRMHESAEFGALDRWNRLRDVPNVVVCDSSCFTTGPEKNPTLTAMAIASRAADHLADELLATRAGAIS